MGVQPARGDRPLPGQDHEPNTTECVGGGAGQRPGEDERQQGDGGGGVEQQEDPAHPGEQLCGQPEPGHAPTTNTRQRGPACDVVIQRLVSSVR